MRLFAPIKLQNLKMSKLVPFDDNQMAFLLNWFARYDTKKKGKVNAEKTIFALRKDKTFASLFRLAEDTYFKHNPESAELFPNKDVESCWKMHIPNEKVNFPQFVRLVALFARQLDSNELRSAPSGKGPSAAIVCDPPRLKQYLANPKAPRDYVPFALNYEKRMYSCIYPPTGNVQDQPCYACCGCGYIIGCVMTIGCSPCLACSSVFRTPYYGSSPVTHAFNDAPWSLLHWAVWVGNQESIKLLIRRRASVDLATSASEKFPCRATPYDLAVYLKKHRKTYPVSEQTLRYLEPTEMKIARKLLKSGKILEYHGPVVGQNEVVADQSHKGSKMILTLAPLMAGDMVRDEGDEESRSFAQRLDDGTNSGVVEGVESAVKQGVENSLNGTHDVDDDDDDSMDEPEVEEEVELELDEDVEVVDVATGGFFAVSFKSLFGLF